jgi:ferric-dicitrate binding protein FerR (iron transport regulator)
MENDIRHIDPVELLPKYFADEATSNEREIVEKWRDVNADNKKEFDSFAKLWHISGPVKGLEVINLDAEWERMERAMGPVKTNVFILRRVLQIAAAVVFISILSFLGIKYSSIETQKSTLAELKTVNLPDGSIISLNAGSKITYKKGFGNTHRNISLKGEAYFEVAKNAAVPFVIDANGASIKVVGTKFNVKAYKDKTDIRVMVTEGKVQLFETKQPVKHVTLSAGESATFNKTEKIIRKEPASDLNDIAWKTQDINFNNTPLSQVIDVLINTYHIDISISPEIKDCVITVQFKNQELTSVLKVLKSTLKLKIDVEGDRILITGNGC